MKTMMQHEELFTRHAANPVIKASDLPVPCAAVCNPAAHLVNGETLLLLRVVDTKQHSQIWAARSADGVGDWRFDTHPLLGPQSGTDWYDADGSEDPRLVFLADRDEYAITYAGSSRFGAGVCLATTQDFRAVTRHGMVIHPYNKDGVLFPRKVNERYVLLHRPTAGPQENIWLSTSDNLTDWGSPCCVLEECDQPGWDSGKVGAGPPPMETPDGWLLIFHGVQQTDNGWLYRVGLALLDLDNPARVLARSPQWVFGPRAPYEMMSPKPGIVFPTGTVIKDGTVYLYYGAADNCVGLATAPLSVLLGALKV